MARILMTEVASAEDILDAASEDFEVVIMDTDATDTVPGGGPVAPDGADGTAGVTAEADGSGTTNKTSKKSNDIQFDSDLTRG